jgi:hypothetical protein
MSEASHEALDILRDGSTFEWSTIPLLAFVMYVYAVEVERRRWDVVLAGLAFFAVDVFNELVNSLIFHASDRAPLWTVTGDTSYLILIGWNVEIVFLFLVSGIIFVKMLPAEPRGLRARLPFIFAFSVFCVAVEVVLETTGYFTWDYWWWDWPFIPLIVVLGYMTFFAAAAYVYDLGDDRRRQLRLVGGVAAIDAVLALSLGLAGWL